MTDAHSNPTLHKPERSVFLTDGVVAIAVTLLALDLKPELPHNASSGDLAHYLNTHAGQYFAFLLAFFLIARFWLLHHRIMNEVRALDSASIWMNLLFLFAITCIPLTTYIQGTYSSALATTLFAGSLLLVSVALALFADLTNRRGLTKEPESHDDRVVRRWRMVGVTAVPVIVIALAWVVRHAEYFFLLATISDVPAKIAARRLHVRPPTA
jgi:TMEM175 potassium channel family protein